MWNVSVSSVTVEWRRVSPAAVRTKEKPADKVEGMLQNALWGKEESLRVIPAGYCVHESVGTNSFNRHDKRDTTEDTAAHEHDETYLSKQSSLAPGSTQHFDFLWLNSKLEVFQLKDDHSNSLK